MQQRYASRPKVGLIAMGGTIASASSDPLDTLDYALQSTQLDAHALLTALPSRFHEMFEVTPLHSKAVYSPQVGRPEWLELARIVETAFSQDPRLCGIVITHGTATLEETAYTLHLTIKSDRPVVMTAAQRPSGAVGADGPADLLAAIRVAGNEMASGRGVLVVMNDEIYSARDVTKSSTYRLNSFIAAESAPLGSVDGGAPQFVSVSLKRHTVSTSLTSAHLACAPRVDITYSHADSDGTAVDAFIRAGAAGIVSAGFLPGLVTACEADALSKAVAEGCVVVQSCRGLGSRVRLSQRLQLAGLIAADSLSPQKARILLMLALGAGLDRNAIQHLFDTH